MTKFKLVEHVEEIELGKWYRPSCSLPTSIIILEDRSWMRQESNKKSSEQLEVRVGLLTEMRLKLNEGTQRTSWRINEGVTASVPMCITKAWLPSISLLVKVPTEVMEVRKDARLKDIAPLSIIHDVWQEDRLKDIPDKFVVGWLLLALFTTTCGLLIKASNWWHCLIVKGNALKDDS